MTAAANNNRYGTNAFPATPTAVPTAPPQQAPKVKQQMPLVKQPAKKQEAKAAQPDPKAAKAVTSGSTKPGAMPPAPKAPKKLVDKLDEKHIAKVTERMELGLLNEIKPVAPMELRKIDLGTVEQPKVGTYFEYTEKPVINPRIEEAIKKLVEQMENDPELKARINDILKSIPRVPNK